MRNGIDGLPSRVRLQELLPPMLADDDLASRWVSGLDEVLAPVLHTLDSLEAYFDPTTAPRDFLEWLASWVGAPTIESLDEPTARELVGSITYLHSMRGTLAGLAHVLDLLAPARVVGLEDGGGVTWSLDPTEVMSAEPAAVLTLRLAGDIDAIEQTWRIAQSWVPAHVRLVLEVVDR